MTQHFLDHGVNANYGNVGIWLDTPYLAPSRPTTSGAPRRGLQGSEPRAMVPNASLCLGSSSTTYASLDSTLPKDIDFSPELPGLLITTALDYPLLFDIAFR
jgi:hypothetical protein